MMTSLLNHLWDQRPERFRVESRRSDPPRVRDFQFRPLSTGELLRRYARLKKKSDYLSKQLMRRLETRGASGSESDGPTQAEIKERLLCGSMMSKRRQFRGELKQSGMDEASIETLKWERRSLMDLNARRTSEDWIHEFGNREARAAPSARGRFFCQ